MQCTGDRADAPHKGLLLPSWQDGVERSHHRETAAAITIAQDVDGFHGGW